MTLWPDLMIIIVAVVAVLLAGAALFWSREQGRRLQEVEAQYAQLTSGTQGGDLEAVLNKHLENVRAAVTQASEAQERTQQMEERARSHVQHVAVVRYNPFDHTGGDQSFVLVLADADGNGAIVNSLHRRDGTRIYAKPLLAWASTHALTEEEQQAIDKARA